MVPGRTLFNRYPNAALDDAFGDGVAGQTGGVVNAEFRHVVLPMFVDRLESDAQFRRMSMFSEN